MTTAEVLNPTRFAGEFAGDEIRSLEQQLALAQRCAASIEPGLPQPDFIPDVDTQDEATASLGESPETDVITEIAAIRELNFLRGCGYSETELAGMQKDERWILIHDLSNVFIMDRPNVGRSTEAKRREHMDSLQDSILGMSDEAIADKYGVSPSSPAANRVTAKRWFRENLSSESHQALLIKSRGEDFIAQIPVVVEGSIDLTIPGASKPMYQRIPRLPKTEESKDDTESPAPPLLLDPDNDDEPLPWQEEALCAQTDPEAFFPEKGGSTKEAKRVCGRCDVRGDCLNYALRHDEKFGIWGGLSERERRRLKRRVI